MTRRDAVSLPAAEQHFVRCQFAVAGPEELDRHRGAHRDHVAKHAHLISYGGLVGEAGTIPIAVCYFLRASAADTQAFVESDPYRPLYVDVRIEPFIQRLPTTAP